MRRTKLIINCYLSLSLCAQADSLDKEMEAIKLGLPFDSLEDKLNELHMYYQGSSINIINKDADRRTITDKCFLSFLDIGLQINNAVHSFRPLADLSAKMVNKTDELLVNREVLRSIDSAIDNLEFDRKLILLQQEDCNKLPVVKSDQLLRLVERAMDLLASVKGHF
jgi:hypothetical protein